MKFCTYTRVPYSVLIQTLIIWLSRIKKDYLWSIRYICSAQIISIDMKRFIRKKIHSKLIKLFHNLNEFTIFMGYKYQHTYDKIYVAIGMCAKPINCKVKHVCFRLCGKMRNVRERKLDAFIKSLSIDHSYFIQYFKNNNKLGFNVLNEKRDKFVIFFFSTFFLSRLFVWIHFLFSLLVIKLCMQKLLLCF